LGIVVERVYGGISWRATYFIISQLAISCLHFNPLRAADRVINIFERAINIATDSNENISAAFRLVCGPIAREIPSLLQ